MMTKDEVLAPLAALRTTEVVVTTMGMVRPWAHHSRSELDFASADSAMGHAADLALGIALAQPGRKVVCLNGDGSMLMSLGTLVLAAAEQAANFVLFVVQNDTFEITGNQPVAGVAELDFALLGRGAGLRQVHAFDDPDAYRLRLPGILTEPGPTLVVVKTEPGREPPLARGPREAVPYLRPSLAESARRLRAALAGGSKLP
jgi:thiamine pyrophosphate-dependent acetolactate synthase large subunit-like protein